MKGLFIRSTILIFAIGIIVTACQNSEWEFDDFDYTTCYFPWQYPVRTIILGETDYDNTNDLNHQFLISATIGGVRENRKDRVVSFELAEELLQNLSFDNGRIVKILPASHYSFLHDKIVIPKGSISGGVKIQLTDAFFEDDLSYSTNYVIPVRITQADTDSILVGKSEVDTPDPRIASHWAFVPKNFTLFGIKYINKFHGNYLLRGKAIVTNITTNEVTEAVYRNEYVEKDIVTGLSTRGLKDLLYSRPVPGASGLGSYLAKITVDSDGTCQISNYDDSQYVLSGDGRYAQKTESWGNKSRNAFYLNIDLFIGNYHCNIKDTLVFRDNSISFEEYTPVVN